MIAHIGTTLFLLAYQVPAAGAAETAPVRVGLLQCIRITLEKDPQIQLKQADVRSAEGALQVEQGLFDINLEANADGVRDVQPVVSTPDAVTQSASYQFSASKLFYSGLEVTPTVSYARTDVDQPGVPVENRGSLTVDLTYPLLRGQGREITTAGERAAQLEKDATYFDLQHTISDRVLQTVVAYWQYLAEVETLEVLKASEARSRQMVDEVSTLIDAGELPRNELLQLQANLGDKQSARIAGENAVFNGRVTLGLVMGLDHMEILQLAPPGEEFPQPKNLQTPPSDRAEAYIEQALKLRADYRASKIRQDSQTLNLKVARDNLRPNLDLRVSTGYNSLGEGSRLDQLYAALYDHTAGPNYSVSLSYRFPLKNRAARGRFAQSQVSQEKTAILVDDLRRNIGALVLLSLDDLQRGYDELVAAQESVRYYDLALTNERKKMKLGFATLIDVINYEDRLTAVVRRAISAHARFMQDLAGLRFETGTLFITRETVVTLTLQDLIDLPFR